jgi:hypothetical protein
MVGGVAVAGFLLEHLAVDVHFFGKFGGLATLTKKKGCGESGA